MELKKISPAGVEKALARAKHYRLLKEPHQAESICLDLLAVDSDNNEGKIVLLLALTDQFKTNLLPYFKRAAEMLPGLDGDYERAYYEGVVYERRALAQLSRGGLQAGAASRDWLERALACYERAEGLSSAGNDDAILRRNSCVRLIEGQPGLAVGEQEDFVPLLE